MLKGPKLNYLVIHKTNYQKLLRWSFSVKEIGGLCFGIKNQIKYVERLTNQTDSRHYYSWDKTERKNLITDYQKRGLELIAEFHSHCNSAHLKTPSKLDVKYFQSGLPHLICFPLENKIRSWIINRSLEKTKSSTVTLKIISK